MTVRFSIRTKLLASFLLILLVSYASLVATTVRGVDASLQEKQANDLDTALKFLASEYHDNADQVRASLSNDITAPSLLAAFARRDRPSLQATLRGWQQALPHLDFAVLVDREQKVVARLHGPAAGDSYAFLPLLAQVLKTGEGGSSTELFTPEQLAPEKADRHPGIAPAAGGGLVQVVVLPLREANGNVVGAVVFGDLLNRDQHLMRHVQEVLGLGVTAAIYQGEYRITGSGEADPPGERLPGELLSRLRQGRSLVVDLPFAGRLVKAQFAPLRNQRGKLVGSLAVALASDDYQQVRSHAVKTILFSAGVGVVFCIGIALVAARRLTSPLQELVETSRRITSGELTERVVLTRRDEFAQVAEAFNRMLDSLEERDRTIRGKSRALQELNEQLEQRVAVRTAELQLEKGRLEAILTSLAEGVLVTDRQERVIVANPAAQQIFRLVPHQLLDRPLREACTTGELCQLAEQLELVHHTYWEASVHEVTLTSQGRQLQVKLSPLLDQQRAFGGVVMSIRDVTLEQEVERMKSEFISAVSHELKTPLTSIKGSLQYLLGREAELTPTVRELLTVCERNSERLNRLITDLLDLSRLDAGRLEFTFRPEPLEKLVAYALEEQAGAARNREISLQSRLPQGLPPVYADHDRLLQVLSNLLVNAIKFSPAGGTVTVAVERAGHFVEVAVSDDGPVILMDQRQRLFQKFQTIGGSDAPTGTGLGLAICREIVEHHQGRIVYRAGDGHGNTFAFTIPVYDGEEEGQG